MCSGKWYCPYRRRGVSIGFEGAYHWTSYGRELEGQKASCGENERSFKVNVRFFCGCLYFQLEVHVRDECPATEVQCEYKNLGCEAVV